MGTHRPAVPPRFKLLRRIGDGGMGIVYETLDVERGVRIALKTVLHHDADALARFKNEFRALQDIHHPNLVGLGELVADEDDVFFTMELIEGTDLLTYVRGESRRVDASGAQTMVDARRAADVTFIDPPRDVTIDDATPYDPPLVALATEGAGFDEVRLRDAFRQIALGLSALHEANKVHRDVKPSNVRVTPEGRVVLLDFGLVLDTDERHETEASMMAGTPAYMAPEQVSSHGVGPEADWYAMGVMMYQCLTGRRPFEGTTMDVMAAKLVRDPPPPSAFVAGIPRDLDALCAHLLSCDKADRPLAREILQRLDANVPVASAPNLAQSGATPFVGRARELLELARAFADVVDGRAVTIAVQGESGVGKSCLVKRFLEEVLPTQGEDVLVLTGRCYEREAVPYKAFDEIIDTLSRRLARMERDELVPLLPDHLEDLAVLFPALLRAPLIAQQAKGEGLDPHERRRHAFDAARGLFSRLARRHRLVLSIDDLQWTDADSLQLLSDLLAPPDAPPMLLIATVRNASESPGAQPSVLASLPGDVRVVSIDRLASDDARELASRLLQRLAPGSSDAGAIAKEAGGHPLFIDELVRHLAITSSGEYPATGALRLDDALAARVDRLDPSARRVLEIACVIGAPISQETVAHAAALDMREFVRVVALLRTSNLVRTSGARVNDAMQPYHDRVREALVARMNVATKRDCHEHIAAALEVSKAFDPEVLASHWAGAGSPAKAAKYAVVAAEQAATSLAFDRAARLYEWAIALLPDGDPRRHALRRQLGDALSSAGKGSRAAAEYEAAARYANPADAIDLRRRAASQLLRTGEMARGIEVSRVVLAAVGMRLPQTTVGAVLALLWFRFLLRLRGLGFTPRDESRIAPTDLLRLDACSSVADTLAYADGLRGGVFHTRHLLLALRLGESRHVARALGAEAAYLAARGSKTWNRTQRVIARARDVGERVGTSESRASVLAFIGPAYCINMRYAKAAEALETAITIFRAEVPGSVWEVTTLRFFLFMAYAYQCRFVEQRAQQEAALKEAIERGDNYAAVLFRIGVLNRIWWMAGDPARARRELDAAVRGWPAGSSAFDMIHFHQLIGYGYIELYEDKGAEVYARVKASLPVLRRSFLLHLEPIRLEVSALRARAALCVAFDPACTSREALVREAEHSIRELEGRDEPVIRWAARSIQVGIAALRNRPDEVKRLLDHIATDEAEEAWAARTLARWVLGAMRGGVEGDAQVRAAQSALAARGLRPDAALFRVQFTGLDVAALLQAARAAA